MGAEHTDNESGSTALDPRTVQEIVRGVAPHEIGVFVRSAEQLERSTAAIVEAGPPHVVLDERIQTTHGHVSVSTMVLAKGLEFRTVLVMACDDEVLPLQSRIDEVGDDADLEEVYDTERHLLYAYPGTGGFDGAGGGGGIGVSGGFA